MSSTPEQPSDADLATLRHELRTPINQIIGYAEMLEEDARGAGQAESAGDLQKIQQAARNLLKLVNENLIPSHFGAGSVKPPATLSPNAAPGAELPQHIKHRFAKPDHGHLLVVDDNPDNRDMLAKRLAKQGYTVACAENGRLALEALRRESFDLVLLDIMMPEMDGYQTLNQIKGDNELRHLPVIMISALDELESVLRCIEAGAEDYLPKPFDPTLLRARIGACLEKKRAHDQEQLYCQALVESQKALATELNEAANYVRSLLPAPLKGDVKTDWRFIPSTQLGGDALGYHWLDQDHLAMYLLDVCGHGVGAALLSISIANVLRSQSLPSTDFRHPGEVLNMLNQTFPMEKQNDMYFTIWYGVYDKARHQLHYASGGHPYPVLFTGPSQAQAGMQILQAGGVIVGTMPNVSYRTVTVPFQRYNRLYIFSDGIYEVTKKGGGMLTLDQFSLLLKIPPLAGLSHLDSILRRIQDLHGSSTMEDDVSIMEAVFD
ncbi:MAG: SpoIIE family protein phosphatase [Verrucomicrobiae bacterium]|nr:SpoIIE family protein phosphatase [Verrucomicrobiae bacterium]